MRTIISVFIAVGIALSAAAASAQEPAQREVKLAIEQQTLADALAQWAQQTGLQLISQVELTTVLTAPRLHGTYSAQGALDRLLEGTSLTYVWLNERTVAVRSRPPAGDQRSSTSVGPDAARLQFANLQAEDSPRFQRVAQAGSSTTRPERIPEVQLSYEVLDEVVVTGSRLKRGRDDGPAPVITFDSARIEQLGVTTVADVLDYLPQQPFTLREFGTPDGRRVVRLRGLGVGTTLVLVNGRRTVTSAIAAATNVFDLNTLPISAVDRVEVLSDSASAVYGADAVGGVVNVILKSYVDQPTVDVFYGAAEGGADEKHASFSLGGKSERVRGLIVVDAFDREALLGSEREFLANQDFRRFGGSDLRSTIANPGNVASLFPGNLPGLNSPFAAVPEGSSGVGLTPADFAATAGTQNRESLLRYLSVVPEAQRLSIWGTGELALTESTALFTELMWSDREGVLQGGKNGVSQFPVFDTNPFNPFGVPVLIDYLFDDLPSLESRTESETARAVIGVKGSLGSWDAEASVLGTRDKGSSGFWNTLDFARLFAAFSSPDPAQALNPFADGPAGSSELLRSFVVTNPIVNRNESQALQWSGFVRGSLFTLPAGEVQVVLGGEARTEKIHFEQRPASVPLDADRKTYAAYSEARVPLVPRSSGIGRWTVTLAGRYDHYDDFGDTFNPEYGLEWSPLESLLIRSSYGTSFRPPSLWDLYQPTASFPGLLIFDPLRNNEPAFFTLINAGNQALEPEESESWTFGFVFRPKESFKASVTYWDVEQTERIQLLPLSLVLLNGDTFADLIVRDAPTPGDVAAGLPGRLLSLTNAAVNFGSLKTSGIDASIQTRFETKFGGFAPSLDATWLHRFSSADLPGLPPVERVGLADVNGTLPRWRATGSLAWDYRAFGASVTGRYGSHYGDVTTANVRTGRTVPASTIVDLQATVDLGEALGSRTPMLRDLKLRVGAFNAFDKRPKFAEVGGSFGYDISQADARQRLIYVSASKSF